jgi:hypothetical protein
MKRILLSATLAVGFLAALPSSSPAATDQSKFDKLIAKYAVPDDPPGIAPKAGCVCNVDNLPGFVVKDVNSGTIYCQKPHYTPEGVQDGGSLCGRFTILGR